VLVTTPHATRPEKLIFLPGAGGDRARWRPLADRLPHAGERVFVGWPGLGGEPADPSVRGMGDLVARVVEAMTGPAVLFAQSMGGIVALRAALARPERVRGLVLSVTSGGIDVAALGGAEWRAELAAEQPGMPRWFLDADDDLSAELGRIAVPALLLWGDADPISPVAVGERLSRLLPDAELVILAGGTHDLVSERAADVSPHVTRYLGRVLGGDATKALSD
jgi:pimeloyl-ACP methyl ester carboxylesterase